LAAETDICETVFESDGSLMILTERTKSKMTKFNAPPGTARIALALVPAKNFIKPSLRQISTNTSIHLNGGSGVLAKALPGGCSLCSVWIRVFTMSLGDEIRTPVRDAILPAIDEISNWSNSGGGKGTELDVCLALTHWRPCLTQTFEVSYAGK